MPSAACGRASRVIGLVAPIPALAGILVAVILAADWWRFWDNAFSDLGNPRYDFVSSIVFNSALYTSAVLVSMYALTRCALGAYGAAGRAVLLATGYSLGLVAVFSEVYGRVHFAVSVLFFLSILVFTLAYTVPTRRPGLIASAVVADTLSAVFWYLHLARDTPPGAAPPELASVIILLAFYYHGLVRVYRRGGGV